MIEIIIRCSFFFPSIGQQPTTWPANNCLQIMICSFVVLSEHVLLQIIFCSCVIRTTFSKENGWSLPWATRKWLKHENKLRDRIIIKTIIELRYRKISWFVSMPIGYLPQSSASANNSQFSPVVIKTKTRNHSMNKVKNLRYDRYWYINNLAKNQVFAVFHLRVICRSMSPKL